MKALIVSPYLDHLGGGERYMLTVASVLEELGYSITFAWDNLPQIIELATMLGIQLSHPQLAPQIKNLYFNHRPLAMYRATRPYDVVVYLSDGSIPLLGGRRNLLHMQVPFHQVGGRKLSNRIKLQSISHVLVNSRFTQRIVNQEYGINSVVLYPPVPTIPPAPKTNTILSVGRFDPSLNTKQHNILIDAFRQLAPQLTGWRLILAGGSSNDEWLNQLRALATGLAIEFFPNLSHPDLCSLYAESRLYWHAAGFGVDERKNPELTEHFGISTVEAISAGCIPLVVPYGGQREIVTDPNLHWENIDQLVTKTLWLVGNPPVNRIDISAYSADNFAYTLKSLL